MAVDVAANVGHDPLPEPGHEVGAQECGDRQRHDDDAHRFEAVGIVIVALAIATFLRSYLVTWLGERVVADIRHDVYGHILHLSPGFFEVTRTGEVLSRLTTDTSVIQTVIGASVTQALRNALLVLGGLVLLVVTNPRLTGFILIVVPLVVVPIVVIGRRVRMLSRAAQDRMADVSGTAEETINAIRTVQSFAQEDRETEWVRLDDRGCVRRRRALRLGAGTAGATIITLVFGAIAVVLWLGGHDVLAGRITAGELSAFVFYATVVASAAGGLSDVFGDLQRAAGVPSGCSSCWTPRRRSQLRWTLRRCRPRAPARCGLNTLASPTHRCPTAWCWATSTSMSGRARPWPWLALLAPGRPASSNC